MNKYKNAIDIILLVLLAALTALHVFPNSIVMSDGSQMMLLACILLFIVLFLSFMWREQPKDERDIHNLSNASRYGYIAGSIVLIIGIAWQSLQHTLDPFMLVALLVMIATKVLVHRSQDNS